MINSEVMKIQEVEDAACWSEERSEDGQHPTQGSPVLSAAQKGMGGAQLTNLPRVLAMRTGASNPEV